MLIAYATILGMEPSAPVAEPPAAPSPPVMDVTPPAPMATPPPEDEPDLTQNNEPVAPPPNKPKPPKAKASPKPHNPNSSVTAAIVATVIIVLGLAALATYAYLKTR